MDLHNILIPLYERGKGVSQECYGLKHDFAASDRRNTLIIRMTRISILLKSVPFVSVRTN